MGKRKGVRIVTRSESRKGVQKVIGSKSSKASVQKRTDSYRPASTGEYAGLAPKVIQPHAIAPVTQAGLVILSVPVFRARRTVRQAITSLLEQTYGNVLVLAISDADPDASLEVVDDLDHPRLVKYVLPKNRGPYYVHDIVLRVGAEVGADFFGIQDSDDWSPPHRVARLVELCLDHQADAVFGGDTKHKPNGRKLHAGPKLYRVHGASLLEHLAKHGAGLYSTQALLELGGYHAGVKVGFDTAILRAITNLGRTVYVGESLYHWRVSANSLTTGRTTGYVSPYRTKVRDQLRAMLHAALRTTKGREAQRQEWRQQVERYGRNSIAERMGHVAELTMLAKAKMETWDE